MAVKKNAAAAAESEAMAKADNITIESEKTVNEEQTQPNEEEIMAVKKNATAAAEGEIAAKTDNITIESERTVNEEQTQPKEKEKILDKVKLIYIGPSLPKAMLKSNKIFEGTREDIEKELEAVIKKFPMVKRMLVPVTELAEKKDKVKTAGNILNKYYSDIVSAASAMEKEG